MDPSVYINLFTQSENPGMVWVGRHLADRPGPATGWDTFHSARSCVLSPTPGTHQPCAPAQPQPHAHPGPAWGVLGAHLFHGCSQPGQLPARTLQGLQSCVDVALGTWFSCGLGNIRFTSGLVDLEGLFQSQWFMSLWFSCIFFWISSSSLSPWAVTCAHLTMKPLLLWLPSDISCRPPSFVTEPTQHLLCCLHPSARINFFTFC